MSCLQAVAVALYNPEAFRTLGQVRLDVGRVLPEHMTDEAYRELLVCLSSLYIHKILHGANHNDCTCAGNHVCAQTDDSFVVSSTVMQKRKLRLTSCFWIGLLTENMQWILSLTCNVCHSTPVTLLGEWEESV